MDRSQPRNVERSRPRDTAPGDAEARPFASQQKDIGEALRQSDEQFRLLVDAVTEYAIFMLDPGGRVISWNKGSERIKGYTSEEILGRHFSAFYTAEDVEAGAPECTLNAAVQEGKWSGERWRVRKDGTRFWAHVTVTALYDEEDTLHGFAKVTRDLTERREQEEALRQREKALRESERRYRRLFEASQEAIYLIAPDGKVIDVNRACCELWGYTREEMLRMEPIEGFVEDADRQEMHRVLQERGALRRREVAMRRKDGGTRLVQMSMTPIYSPEGDVQFYQAFARDVTEERQAIDALRESERRYRRLFEEAQEGISLTTPESRVIDVNPAAEDILGYSREEVLKLEASALYVDLQEHKQMKETLDEEGAVRGAEVRMHRKDGKEIICEISSTARRGLNGQVEVYQTFFRDVTERKQAEEALRESEEKFRVLAEKALVGVALLQDGVYQYVNPALARIVGYAPEEIIGASPATFLHSDDWPAVREGIKRCLDGTVREIHYQARLLTKEGRVRRVEVLGSRFTYRGEPAIIGTVTDVTERRRLQREVLRIQEAERRRLGQDLHDGVASQLTGVGAMLSTLSHRAAEEDKKLSAGIQETQELIQESARDVRRLSRGLAPAGLSGKELPAVLGRLANNVEEARFEHDSDLLDLPDDTAAHLYWIAQEAVANAQRYAEARTIAIRLRRRDGGLVLEVEDDGRGFAPANVEESSLGLRTMRYRAELLGASFSIDTAPGEGTRVRCRLAVEG